MKNIFLIPVAALCLLPLTGCDDKPPEPPKQQTADQQTEIVEDRLSDWMGKWDGPEGTYLKLEKSGDGYAVIIKDLDKEERYLGVADNMRIRFLRGEKQEYLHLGSGRDAGMKWLSDKPYCLIVKTGEAYCRDKM
jgi:predicted small lipoprotein YifL